MGIRFQCPNGHKINVKAFLAGKRALCPECGAKVVVPFESQTLPTLSAMPTPAAAPSAAPVPAPAIGSSNGGSSKGASTEKRSPVVASAPAATGVATAAPVSTRTASPAVSPSFNVNLAAAAAVVSAPIVPPSPTLPLGGPLDPIAEAPQAVWYVRPRTGGQFGPAPGEIFRQWIAQRRVTADSLVWRDGWTDWRVAGEVLPQLATRTPPAFSGVAGAPAAAPLSPASTTAEPANAPATRYIRARRSKSSTIVAICVLGIVAVALVGVLIFILTRQP